ncbi:MAG: hypothetical protein WCE68_09890 [Anaerolineales bacterium]
MPDDWKKSADQIIEFIETISNLVVQIIDPMLDSIVDMLYWYLLTGEAQELPNGWLSKVATIPMLGETMVMAMAVPMANPDVVAYQFREEYKKAFGSYRPKVTNMITNTADYLQLRKAGKPWNFIVEEFIRLNDYQLPRDRSSKRYQETLSRYEQRLKKRMQRTESLFEILTKDKK